MRNSTVEEVAERLRKSSGGQGFNKWLSARLVDYTDTSVSMAVDVRADMTQHHGFVHGGCVSALADMAAAWAGAISSGRDVVTSSFSLHFISPAIGERLEARATALRTGRTVATVEVQVFAQSSGKDDKLCAAGIASIAILPNSGKTASQADAT